MGELRAPPRALAMAPITGASLILKNEMSGPPKEKVPKPVLDTWKKMGDTEITIPNLQSVLSAPEMNALKSCLRSNVQKDPKTVDLADALKEQKNRQSRPPGGAARVCYRTQDRNLHRLQQISQEA